MGDLSAHFSTSEFVDRRTGRVKVSPGLVEALERLREALGRPIHIRSGYRSPSTNRAVGGARRSQHLYGRAADIDAGPVTVEQAIAAGFTGVGHKAGLVSHVDVRPGPVSVWQY